MHLLEMRSQFPELLSSGFIEEGACQVRQYEQRVS